MTPELLDRYLAGEASAAERLTVDAWIGKHEIREDLVAALRGCGNVDTEQWLRRVKASFVAEAPPNVPATRGDRRAIGGQKRGGQDLFGYVEARRVHLGERSLRTKSLPPIKKLQHVSIMAIVALVLALGAVSLRRMGVASSTPAALTYSTYATHNGQIAHVTLADSTRVTLAPNSHVGVASDFPVHRDITLMGEAYFEVASHRGAPFLVHTGRITTRALGTAFDVTHYTDDRDVRVVVANGKVTVATPRNAAVALVPRTLAHVTDSTTLVTAIDDAASYSAWTQGMLEFHDVAVHDVLRTVGRWYGIRLQLTDSTLSNQRIDTFLSFTNVHDVIKKLEEVLSVTATDAKNGESIILQPRTQKVRPASLRRDESKEFPFHAEVGR